MWKKVSGPTESSFKHSHGLSSYIFEYWCLTQMGEVSGSMESSFVFLKHPAVTVSEPQDTVHLMFAKCRVIEQTRDVSAEGELSRTPINQGKSKKIYSVCDMHSLLSLYHAHCDSGG